MLTFSTLSRTIGAGSCCLLGTVTACGTIRQSGEVRELEAVTRQFISAAENQDSLALRSLGQRRAVQDIARIQSQELDLFAAMTHKMSLQGSHVVTPDSALLWFQTGPHRDEVVATLVQKNGEWSLVQIGALPR
jgi:hypothetical protein